MVVANPKSKFKKMIFSDTEANITARAVEIVISRARPVGLGLGTSVLCELHNLTHKNKKLTGFTINQLINAITKPLATIFFLSNSVNDAGCCEKLAEFIEANTSSLAIWYH